jgi:glucose-1-phosphate thymidylyltransferase
MNFKGIILAGGQGSRLSPLTDITNKFLMPVYDKLMIEYSVYTLAEAGIKDIAIILGTKSAGETMDYLKSGDKYGVRFTYFYQDRPMGVPNALKQAEYWAGDSKIVVLCADNIMYDKLEPFVKEYQYGNEGVGCLISTKQFKDTETLRRFAILDFDNEGYPCELVEKPHNPPSEFAFCGIQIYDSNVWDIIDGLQLSPRGEYEITHVINQYIKWGEFSHRPLTDTWFDCGNKDALFEAQQYAFLKANAGELE